MLINKILMLFFFLSILNIVRNLFSFIQIWNMNKTIEEPLKFELSDISKALLLLSMAYVLTTIFTGINL